MESAAVARLRGPARGSRPIRRAFGHQAEGKLFLLFFFLFFICLFSKLFQIKFFKPNQNKIK
jgi:hypothetical protein